MLFARIQRRVVKKVFLSGFIILLPFVAMPVQAQADLETEISDYVAAGDLRQALELSEKAFAQALEQGDHQQAARLAITLSDIAQITEDFAKAEVAARSALVLTGNDEITRLTLSIKLADALLWTDKIAQAESVLTNAIAFYDQRGVEEDAIRAELTILLASAYKEREEFQRGIDLLMPEIARWENAPEISIELRAVGLNTLSRLYRQLGHLDKAYPPIRDAVKIYEAQDYWQENRTRQLDYAVKLEALSRIEWGLEKRRESIAHLERAIEIYMRHDLGATRDVILMNAFLTNRLRAVGRREESIVTGARAVDLARTRFGYQLQKPAGVNNNDRIYLRYSVNSYLNSLYETAENPQDNFYKAFQVAQPSVWSQTAQAASVSALNFVRRSPELASLLQQRKVMHQKWTEIEGKITAIDLLENREKDRVARNLIQESQSMRASIDDLTDHISRQFPGYVAFVKPQIRSAAEIADSLGTDDAVIFLHVHYDDVFVFTITEDGYSWQKSAFKKRELCDLVSRFRNSFDQGYHLRCTPVGAQVETDTQGTSLAFDPVIAHELYYRLFGVVEHEIADKKNWKIIPTGVLAALPMNALIKDPKTSVPDWLVKHHSLSILPSVDSLALQHSDLQEGDRRQFFEKYVGIGAPCIGQWAGPNCLKNMQRGKESSVRGANQSVEFIRQLPALPYAVRELKQVAAQIEGDIKLLMGPEATEPAFRKLSGTHPDLLVIATHGLAAGMFDLAEPALVLTPVEGGLPEEDGLVTAGEISSLTLGAKVVMLSACYTAGADGSPRGEMLSGLTQAFLSAGARILIVNHFAVPDGISAEITAAFVRHSREDAGIRSDEALRRALVDQVNKTPDEIRPGPWASLFMVGDTGGAGF